MKVLALLFILAGAFAPAAYQEVTFLRHGGDAVEGQATMESPELHHVRMAIVVGEVLLLIGVAMSVVTTNHEEHRHSPRY
jgi:hypothetical protein